MKLNWAERWVVNNPVRVFEQRMLVQRLKNMRDLGPGATIVEIGCGRGAGAALVLEEFRPSLLHASDLDFAMIRKADKYLSIEQKREISFAVADAAHLPYRDQSVDAVFGFGVLHHIPDWRSAVAEIARILRSGGVYYVEELYPSLYQNFITKHILLHPEEDRFYGPELKQELNAAKLIWRDSIEIPLVGILGVFVKAA